MNNIFCINCGKYNHNYNLCTEPITSCGIICFNINNIKIKNIQEYLINNIIDIEEYNYKNLKYISKNNKFKNDIKFLLIQRKHSIAFIEFLRGNYNEKDNEQITKLFELMSKNEIILIKTYDFDYLWNKLWFKTVKKKKYYIEFNISKIKFNYLKINNLINNLESKYNTPEWGFPKGRRNKYENNIECANREFIEEALIYPTKYENKYTVFHRLSTLNETFYGTDNILYKHIYYIAGTDDNNYFSTLDKNMESTFEVGDIGWFTIDEIIHIIRPYNITKINVINQLYFFLATILNKI